MAGKRKAAKKATGTFGGAPLGSGKNFAAVEAAARKSGATDPAAVAAAAGRKKYGAKKFGQLAAQGRTGSTTTSRKTAGRKK